MIESKKTVAGLFEAALELPLEEQTTYLARECVGQPLLLAELESLLKSDDEAEAESFMRQPALQIQAHQIASELAETRSGQTIGRYQLLELIGEGGMGEVYLAQDQELDRKVAVKLIKGNFKTQELLRRFNNERQILAHLNHANIAGLLDGGTTDDGIPFFVMEHVEGQPIDRYADEHQLSTTDRLKLFRTVCEAVQYAHQHLVIHRDLKPTNILVTSEGDPKLLDFGIAKLLVADDSGAPDETAAVFRVMTPEYASPEQIKGEPITTATDVYSLGVVLYELLTGQRPHKFRSRQPADIAEAICIKEPDKPSQVLNGQLSVVSDRSEPAGQRARASKIDAIPQSGGLGPQPGSPVGVLVRNPKSLRGDIDNIVLMAMRKDPLRRYTSVGQLSEDIGRHLAGLPVIARTDTFAYRASKFIKRNKVAVVAAVIVTVAVLGGFAATAWEAHVARAERVKAEHRFNDVRKLANSFLFEFHDSIRDLPGSLAARQLVVKRALEYLDSLDQESSNDKALHAELAIAYAKLADITSAFDVQQSLDIQQKAIALDEELVRTEPGNSEYREHLVQSYQYTSDILKLTGDTARALEFARKGLAIAGTLAADNPQHLGYRQTLAESYVGVGMMLRETGELNDSLKNQLTAAGIYESLRSEGVPATQYTRDLCAVYAHISTDFLDMADYPSALQYTLKTFDLTEEFLAADPTNAGYRRNAWANHVRRGKILARSGQQAAAMDDYRKGLSYIDQLATADPKDLGHQRGLAITYLAIGQLLVDMNKPGEATVNYQKALAISESLERIEPKKIETRADLASMNASMGRLLTKTHQSIGALEYLKKAMTLAEESTNTDPHNARYRRGLAEVNASMGDACEQLVLEGKANKESQSQNWREARTWYQKSLDIYQDMKSKGILSGADAGKPDDVAREIARCDLALRK